MCDLSATLSMLLGISVCVNIAQFIKIWQLEKKIDRLVSKVRGNSFVRILLNYGDKK